MAKHVELYQDEAGEHRWRLVAANGEVIADSGEGYVNRGHAIDMAQEVNPGVPIEDEETQ